MDVVGEVLVDELGDVQSVGIVGGIVSEDVVD